mmetsp:Transcript_3375/g.13463  ORF Transcript_3375/g.13463 Transcript_3375/m.13463 type:complete len:252 (-) Transcript_3375:50-805(-)
MDVRARRAPGVVVALLVSCASAARPSLDVFIESGCPECQSLVATELNRTLEADGVLEAIDFRLVAFGNSYWPVSGCAGQETYNRRYGSPCWVRKCGVPDAPEQCWGSSASDLMCQHGAAECQNDLLINCAMVHNPEPEVYMPFVTCLEKRYPYGAMTCAQKLGLDFSSIQACAADEAMAWQVTKDAGEATAQARIPGTPTLFLNGVMMASYVNLLSQVCETFEQEEAPLGCSSIRKPCDFFTLRAWIDTIW